MLAEDGFDALAFILERSSATVAGLRGVIASLTEMDRRIAAATDRVKALLAHTAIWPESSAALIRQVIGPPEGRFHVRQKDNIRRFLGFGM